MPSGFGGTAVNEPGSPQTERSTIGLMTAHRPHCHHFPSRLPVAATVLISQACEAVVRAPRLVNL